MKTKLIAIIGATEKSDEEKAKEIIALAVVKKASAFDSADKAGGALVAYRETIEEIGKLDASEASLSPRLMCLLCSEMERRAQAFATAFSMSVLRGDD